MDVFQLRRSVIDDYAEYVRSFLRIRDSRLRDFVDQSLKLEGKGDPKLQKVVPIVKQLVKDSHHPILFCRFIATAEYLADQYKRLSSKQLQSAVSMAEALWSKGESLLKKISLRSLKWCNG